MNSKDKASLLGPEFFFSDNFLIQLKFNDNASVDGWIVHYPIGLNLAETFRGISIEKNGLIKFSFFIEWGNPNLNGKVLTAYSGEIFRLATTGNRLALEWLQVNVDPLAINSPSYKGSEVLCDVGENDSLNEARRVAFFERLAESPKRL